MSIVVYTAIIGAKDHIHPPKVRVPGIRYAMIIDPSFQEPPKKDIGWEIITKFPPRYRLLGHPRRRARYCKAHPHEFFPKAEIWVWLDGVFTTASDKFETWVREGLGDLDVVATKHGERDCLYEEAEVCRKNKLDLKDAIDRQIQEFRRNNFPLHAGLHATGILIRRNCPEVVMFNEQWWSRLELHSVRDQLSFDFVLWQMRLKSGYVGRRMPPGGEIIIDSWGPHARPG